MSTPMFKLTSATAQPRPTFTRTQAASLFGISVGGVDKLLASGFLPNLRQSSVLALTNAPWVHVTAGILPVLRTDAKRDALPDLDRPFIGAAPTMSDDDLLSASDRWWRSDPSVIVDAGCIAVSVSGWIIALLHVNGLKESLVDPEGLLRHHYDADLACRIDDLADQSTKRWVSGEIRDDYFRLLGCRQGAIAGGPVAYLRQRS